MVILLLAMSSQFPQSEKLTPGECDRQECHATYGMPSGTLTGTGGVGSGYRAKS